MTALALWSLATRPGAAPPGRVTRTSIVLAPGQYINVQPSASLALARDGKHLVYGAVSDEGQHLYLRSIDSFETTRIPGSEGGRSPFFSPDGIWIGFFSGDFKMKKVLVAGGGLLPICDVPVGDSGAVWLEDNRIVYGLASTSTGLMSVSADGGIPVDLTTLDLEAGELRHGRPHPLPGGRHLLFTVFTSEAARVEVLSLETGERKEILQGTEGAQYVEGGYLAYGQSGSLLVVPFDREGLDTTDSPTRILDGVYMDSTNERAYFVLASDGTLVYLPAAAGSYETTLVWVDRQGREEPTEVEPGQYAHPQISPDGTRVAVNSNSHIWIFDLDRGGSGTRLTREGYNSMPVWSPDGERIAFSSARVGPAAVYAKRVDGVDEAELLIEHDHAAWPRSWSADGNSLAFYELNPAAGAGRDVFAWSFREEDKIPVVTSPANERSPIFSPDARWIAYTSDESGRDEVYVRSFVGVAGQWKISTEGGREPLWSPDGIEIFYRNGKRVMAVRVSTTSGFSPEAPVRLFEGEYAIENQAHNQFYAIAPDGMRFLMIRESQPPSSRTRMHVVTNWVEELRQRVPTGQ